MPLDAIAIPAAPLTPVDLLAAWEATATPAQVAAQLPHQPAVLAWLTDLAALPRLDINLDLGDARTVLHEAGAIRAATTTASGSGRVGEVLRQLRVTLPASASSAHYALLSALSSPAAPLEMDELQELIEAIRYRFASNGELIFGHGELATAAGLEVRLLLGYVEQPPVALQTQLHHLQAEKAEALAQQDYDVAAKLRDAERRLLKELESEQ